MLSRFIVNERTISYLYKAFTDRIGFLVPNSNLLCKFFLITLESLYVVQSAASLSEPSNLIWLLWILSFFYPIDSKEWNMLFLLVIWTRGIVLRRTSDSKKSIWFKIFFIIFNSYSLMSLLFKIYLLLEVALLPSLSYVNSWNQVERELILKPVNLLLWFWSKLQQLSSI